MRIERRGHALDGATEQDFGGTRIDMALLDGVERLGEGFEPPIGVRARCLGRLYGRSTAPQTACQGDAYAGRGANETERPHRRDSHSNGSCALPLYRTSKVSM